MKGRKKIEETQNKQHSFIYAKHTRKTPRLLNGWLSERASQDDLSCPPGMSCFLRNTQLSRKKSTRLFLKSVRVSLNKRWGRQIGILQY